MTPKEKARQAIDAMLDQCGWIVQDTRESFIELALPVPPLAEVERRLSVVEELSALVESNLKRATRLRQSILQKAFEGRLVRRELND